MHRRPVLVEIPCLFLCALFSNAPGLGPNTLQTDTSGSGMKKSDPCPDTTHQYAKPCPHDRDGDGIPDSLDRCPDEPEIYNFFQDEDGCPDQRPDPVRDGVIPNLHFDSGRAQPESIGVLDSLGAVLKFYPGTQLEIRGFTDDIESPDRTELSLRRAQFVQTYLESLGIDPRRLRVRGMGDQPLQPNRSGAARTSNRRVEIYAH